MALWGSVLGCIDVLTTELPALVLCILGHLDVLLAESLALYLCTILVVGKIIGREV